MIVGQLLPTKIAAVGPSAFLKDEAILSIAKEAQSKNDEIPNIVVGVCSVDDIKGFQGYEERPIQRRGILTFAQFAEIHGLQQKLDLSHFDTYTPGQVLLASRRASLHDNMKSDYETLGSLGALNVYADMIFANGMMDRREFVQSEAMYSTILERKFDGYAATLRPFAFRNLGIVKFTLKKYDEAFRAFTKADIDIKKHKDGYLAPYGIAALRAREISTEVLSDADLRQILRRALEEPKIVLNSVSRSELLAALAELEGKPPDSPPV